MIKVGDKFTRLTVMKQLDDYIDKSGRKDKRWLCLCECGNEKIVRGSYLSGKVTRSCGCLRSEKSSERLKNTVKHGFAGTRIYHTWRLMIDRCENTNNKSYKNYGGKGIKVCAEWKNVENFVNWSKAHGYADNLTIDRIDSKKDYSPDNCRWVDRKTQNNNTSRNHLLTYNGKTQTLAQWSEETGINYGCLKTRINKLGWSVEKSLTTPSAKNK